MLHPPQKTPTLLALDFDGVLCDGLVEYFQTAWRAYCQIWMPADEGPPEGLATQFYRLRPVVETGWEMPVLVRSLQLGVPETEILENWGAIVHQRIAAEGLTAAEVGAKVDRIRDEWITADLNNWLAQHRFYPGIVERLRQIMTSPTYAVIISTKEGRFVRQLLQQQGVELETCQIMGKEVKQPKAQSLRTLLQTFSSDPNAAKPVEVWFVEDRLKTLRTIQDQSDLGDVKLYLADWGYNTAAERADAHQDPQIQLLSLEKFAQDFPQWVEALG